MSIVLVGRLSLLAMSIGECASHYIVLALPVCCVFAVGVVLYRHSSLFESRCRADD
jgi:hypothetical protein